MFSFHAVSGSVNQDLFNKVAEAVVGFMFDRGMITKPCLLNLRNDQGIFLFLCDGMYHGVQTIRNNEIPPYMIFFVGGSKAFSAGVYVTSKQAEFGHAVDQFTDDEIRQVNDAFYDEDLYELGLKTLGISKDSAGDDTLKYLILTAFEAAEAEVGSEMFNEKNFRTCMKVLYNAGVTLLMN